MNKERRRVLDEWKANKDRLSRPATPRQLEYKRKWASKHREANYKAAVLARARAKAILMALKEKYDPRPSKKINYERLIEMMNKDRFQIQDPACH